MSHSLHQDIRTFAAALSRRAGRESIDGRGEDIAVRYKAGNEVVTEMDLRLESLIRDAIAERWPGHRIVGEEAGDSGPVDAEYVWYVDPIDGTRNYSRSIPYFNVSLGVFQGEMPVAGAVYDPILDETYSAHRGGGADCNGEPIRVSAVTKPAEAMVVVDYHRSKLREFDPAILSTMFEDIHKLRMMGAAALDMCNAARGRFDGMVALGASKFKRMDLAAGMCILTEAGGVYRDLNGAAFDWNGAAMVAGSPGLVEALCGLLGRYGKGSAG